LVNQRCEEIFRLFVKREKVLLQDINELTSQKRKKVKINNGND
jgi:hypothetical protein